MRLPQRQRKRRLVEWVVGHCPLNLWVLVREPRSCPFLPLCCLLFSPLNPPCFLPPCFLLPSLFNRCLFWSAITLCKIKEYHDRNRGRPAAAARPVGPHGEGTLIHRWEGVGRHGRRWQAMDRAVANPRGPFFQYALEIYRNQSGTRGTVQLGRIQFKDRGGRDVPYQSHTINNERCHGGGREHSRNLSGGGRGKWCTQLEYFPNNTPRFVFTFREPVTIATVVLTSANDCSERDPSEFALLGVGEMGGQQGQYAFPADLELQPVPMAMPLEQQAGQPVVVMGTVVLEPTAQDEAVPAPNRPTGAAPLRSVCDVLVRELGLEANLTLPRIVDSACEQLGVGGVEGQSLVDRANRCYEAIGSPPITVQPI